MALGNEFVLGKSLSRGSAALWTADTNTQERPAQSQHMVCPVWIAARMTDDRNDAFYCFEVSER